MAQPRLTRLLAALVSLSAVVGASQGVNRSASAAPTPLALQAFPTREGTPAGNNAAFQLSFNDAGAGGRVDLTASSPVGSGVDVLVQPAAIGGACLAARTSFNTKPGAYTIGITATRAGETKSAVVTLDVRPSDLDVAPFSACGLRPTDLDAKLAELEANTRNGRLPTTRPPTAGSTTTPGPTSTTAPPGSSTTTTTTPSGSSTTTTTTTTTTTLPTTPVTDLWAWGKNDLGAVGNGDVHDVGVPEKIGSANDWISISAGLDYSVGVRSDGSLWTWGDNNYGALGDPAITVVNSPHRVGTDNDWLFVEAGRFHVLALKNDGTLWTWGFQFIGGSSQVPTQVGTDTWSQVSAGFGHSLGIKSDGTLWAWGYNASGQVGNGSTTGRATPTQLGSDSNWNTVSAGWGFSLATKSDGALWAWGANSQGQLGNGTAIDSAVPVQSGTSKWRAVSADSAHAVGVKLDGTLWEWGLRVGANAPVQLGTASNWSTTSAGGYHNLALRNDGTLWAWGSNGNGQQGTGLGTSPYDIPGQVGSAEDWRLIAAGFQHSVALRLPT